MLLIASAALLYLLVGYGLQRTRARWLAWAVLVAVLLGADWLLAEAAAGGRMVALLWLAAYGMKAVVGVESHRAGVAPLPFWRWLVFATLWFGMQPADFLPGARGRRVAVRRLVGEGLMFAFAGVLVLALARSLVDVRPRTAGYVCIVGGSLLLHFGIIPLLAAGLRVAGFPVDRQFRAPWLATSLHEFWSRRWNLGFSVMTTLVVYRPVARWASRGVALVAGFVLSGALHELACSVPVRAGYGGPMGYFLLHAGAVAFEHWLQRRGVRVRGWMGRVWVCAWLLLPVPWLFHDAFVRGVVLPAL